MGRDDLRRGQFPEIESDERTITFRLPIVGLTGAGIVKLVVRCERGGEIYLSIWRSGGEAPTDAKNGSQDAAHE
jgi:hypothetical protein